jgi:hypothetical protein
MRSSPPKVIEEPVLYSVVHQKWFPKEDVSEGKLRENAVNHFIQKLNGKFISVVIVTSSQKTNSKHWRITTKEKTLPNGLSKRYLASIGLEMCTFIK